MSELLPSSWDIARLGDLASDITYGFTTTSTTQGAQPKLLRITDIQDGAVHWDAVPRCTDAPDDRVLLRSGDIVIARTGATTGKSYLIVALPEKAVFASYLIRVRLEGHLDPQYVWAFMQSKDYWAQIQTVSKGTAQPGANASILSQITLPIAPFPEQRRIVAKLDSLSAKSRRARDHLDYIPGLVEKYKQAILAAAFRGDLTRDWRKHQGEERASRRIKLQNTKAGAFVRALPELPQLPSSWSWRPLGEVVEIVDPNPSHRYPTYEGGTVPLLSTREFDGKSGWAVQDAPLVPNRTYEEQNARCLFSPNDIIFARKGRLGLARRPPALTRYCFSHTIFVLKPSDAIETQYAIFYLWQDTIVPWLLREMNSNTGVPTLGKATLQQLPIAISPVDEQREITRRIETAFAWIDRLATEATSARKLIDYLDQAVLTKAFRGELVSQDPNDEPASALLMRIKAERSAATPNKRKARQQH